MEAEYISPVIRAVQFEQQHFAPGHKNLEIAD
jgi:hypothetical protein